MFNRSSDYKSLFKLIVLIISFRFLLDYGYINFVYPIFEYSGFSYDINISKIFLSWICILVIFLLLFVKRNNPLIYIYFLIYSVAILPTSSYYALSNNSEQSFWVTIIVFTILILFLPNKKYKSHLQTNLSEKKQNIIIALIIIISTINLAYLIYASGGQYVLSLEDVYDYRAENTTKYLGIFGYLNNWTPKIFVPLLLAVGFIRKSKVIITISIAFCTAFFAFTGHKSVLLPIILCIFLSMVFKRTNQTKYFEDFCKLCLYGLLIFSTLGILLFLWKGEALFGSILFRRAFFVPVYLNDIYFDMFDDQYELIYWSNSVLSSFIDYPYGNVGAAKVVGAYLNAPNLNANTGFIASGFMHAKYVGVSIYTFIIIVINFTLLKISNRVHPIMFNALLLLPFLTLFSSSDLPTTFLTHGLLIAITTLYLYSGTLKLRTS